MEHKSGLSKVLALEPALVRAAIAALFALLLGLGVDWATDVNSLAVYGFLAALLQLGTGFATKSAVTPNDKVLAYLPDPYDKPSVIEAGHATVGQEYSDEVIQASTRLG